MLTKEMLGRRFERLTVIGFLPGPRKRMGTQVVCRCDCGVEKVMDPSPIRRGLVKSCGCFGRQRTMETATHGHAGRIIGKTPEYICWQDMKRRCFAEKHPSFVGYGGRGITVCDRWRDNFEAFLADVGVRPSKAHSLDRIDNDGNYEPGNCRWATDIEQSTNQRTTKFVTYQGVKMPVADICRQLGLNKRTVLYRLAKGWPEEAALTPAKKA